MPYFTENPFERMMQQKPMGRPEAGPLKLPLDHFCYGCSSYGKICFGICHRKLKRWRKEKKGECE